MKPPSQSTTSLYIIQNYVRSSQLADWFPWSPHQEQWPSGLDDWTLSFCLLWVFAIGSRCFGHLPQSEQIYRESPNVAAWSSLAAAWTCSLLISLLSVIIFPIKEVDLAIEKPCCDITPYPIKGTECRSIIPQYYTLKSCMSVHNVFITVGTFELSTSPWTLSPSSLTSRPKRPFIVSSEYDKSPSVTIRMSAWRQSS